ncbi:MAG: Druantia anti-phage system protein DruA [Desulfomonilaceae bacterium]
MQVRRGPLEELFGGLIEQHHYLGYCQPVGEHLKYLVTMDDRPIACFSWSSAPRHIGCRDRFIGWSAGIRKKNIHLIAYNSRCLLLPWVSVPHLASHLLGKMARRISRDWQEVYGHPLYLLETFVNAERFKGTCYRASNWIHLGQTTGRGKDDLTHKPNRSIKDVWGYALDRSFREKLCR